MAILKQHFYQCTGFFLVSENLAFLSRPNQQFLLIWITALV